MKKKKQTYFAFSTQYYCNKCKHAHDNLSEIGKAHWQYRKNK